MNAGRVLMSALRAFRWSNISDYPNHWSENVRHKRKLKPMFSKALNISSSPHIVKGVETNDIMRNVVWALLPVAGFAVYSFGLSAFAVISTTVIASVLTEHFVCYWSGKDTTVTDWSAVITGLLLGLTLPPSFPLWMAFVGGVIEIALGKGACGGLG